MRIHIRRSRRVRGLSAVALTSAMLAVAACGSTSDSDDESNGQAGSAEQRDAELTLAIQTEVSTLDPAQLNEGQATYVWSAVYDTLLTFDNDGILQPNAAESWEYSDDRRTLTLTLRDDLTFVDGTAITAADVAANFERTRTTPGVLSPKLSAVESIEAPDDRTVTLQLSKPDPALLGSLAMGNGAIADAETADDEQSQLRPLASGPYVIDESTVNGSEYVLTRRDDHWNADAYPFQKVTLRVIQDRTATANALLAGEINAGNAEIENLQQLESGGLSITEIPATAVASLLILDRSGEVVPALGDDRVRRAINMAFDREAMVQGLLKGSGQPTDQLFNPQLYGYNADLEGTYEYDPDAARELLAEAGYPDGFDLAMPSTILSENLEPSVTQALADIGITVTWEPVPPQNTVAALSSKEYGMVVFIEGLNIPEQMVAGNLLPNSYLNPFGWTTPKLEELLNSAAEAADETERDEIYQELSAYLVEEEAANAHLFYYGTHWATAEGIEYLGDGSNGLNTVRAFGVTE